MNNDEVDIAEQFEKHLNSPKQTWLLGAGASFESNIPLMYPLTARVFEIATTETFLGDAEAIAIIEFVKSDIAETAHIEIFLTHLSDLISMAERSRTQTVAIGARTATKAKLTSVHLALLDVIADIIRWGYKPANGDEGAIVGESGKSITKIKAHKEFIKAIFLQNRAGLEKHRSGVEFFTTNYDTLIEDALALNQIPYCDGFTGGAVGFWKEGLDTSQKAVVTKLHGSIDWFRSSSPPRPLLRVRYGDTYHSDEQGAVMIYPQASKYVNAQENPFAQLFDRFRNRLSGGTDQVLLICGYSFGDDHINADIEQAMSTTRSQLTIVAFSGEIDGQLPPVLNGWRNGRSFSDRIYIASPKGLSRGASDPCFGKGEDSRNWWTFTGMTKLFSEGLPKDIQEALQ